MEKAFHTEKGALRGIQGSKGEKKEKGGNGSFERGKEDNEGKRIRGSRMKEDIKEIKG